MIKFIKKLFGKAEVAPAAEVAPYKVETVVEAAPAPAPSEVSTKATEAVVKSVAPKKQGGKKPAGNKPKAPRKPKAPKA